MENRIVRDFEKLRVFTNHIAAVNMDELVHDLSFALEETKNITRTRSTDSLPTLMHQALKRQHKKRRSTKRRSVTTGRDSEASESSIDEALKDYMENVSVRSDSDDCIASNSTRRMPISHQNIISLVESDSLTENFSPLRPLRRRRRFKRMAVDACNDEDFAIPSTRVRPKRSESRTKSDDDSRAEPMVDSVDTVDEGTLTRSSVTTGKRKRTYKQSGSGSGETGYDEKASHSSSSLSSSEADHDEATYTQDEAREADDEQSDFFHEPGPVCGIPDIIPWWEHQQDNPSSQDSAAMDADGANTAMATDPECHKILNGTFNHMSASSQRAYKARLIKLLHSQGREIRYGRRRLNDKMPRYSMARYLQDRQTWKDSAAGAAATSNSSLLQYPPGWLGPVQASSTETKRRRKTPPTSGAEVASTPEPDVDISSIQLENSTMNDQMIALPDLNLDSSMSPTLPTRETSNSSKRKTTKRHYDIDMDDYDSEVT